MLRRLPAASYAEISGVEVMNAGRIGRGIFSAKIIQPETLLGAFNSIEISPADYKSLESTLIGVYLWQHRTKHDWSLMPFGWINFLNHSRVPNCKVIWTEDSVGWVAEVWSVIPIAEGAQLFIDYGCSDEELGFIPE